MARRRKIKPYRISRGSFEEQKLREDKKTETQRALLFILPVVMLAVLAVGIFFGYKSYEKSAAEEKTVISGSEPKICTAHGVSSAEIRASTAVFLS